MAAAMTQKACVAGVAVNAAAPSARRQARFVAVRVSALAQKAEYIWYDGQEGQPQKGAVFNEMRSKTKVLQKPVTSMDPKDFPEWSFDGSSTGQAEGNNSDCILRPVCVVPDPIRGGDNVLVMCDVLDAQGVPHESNTRAKLEAIINDAVKAEAPLFGFEQEYTMLSKGGHIYGWPSGGYPAPQGPFYCGVGHESVYGRPLAEAHLDACVKAGLIISGINAEVMPGQWEFQVGPCTGIESGDHLWISRYILLRVCEDFGVNVSWDPKPIPGDWNGAGCHTNYSTKAMREDGGMAQIVEAIEKMKLKHKVHIAAYGEGNERRLTGRHETASIHQFSYGVANRGASIRIPRAAEADGKGYFEDRRPASNMDPYVVTARIVKTTILNED